MNIRFYIDPETGEPHIYNHGISEEEAEDILLDPMEDQLSKGTSRSAIGQTQAGRYLRVIYVPDPYPDSVFVITAYEVRDKLLKAYRRRRRRRE
jgi:hypothetical protein